MTQNAALNTGDPAVEGFFDAIQELLSGAAVNIDPFLLNATTVRIAAGPGHDQAALSIEGQYRYVSAPVDRAMPAGGAGNYDLYATAAEANDPITHAPPTTYAFALAIVPAAGVPAGVALKRKIGTLVWNGTAITELAGAAGPASRTDPRFRGALPVGATVPYAGSGDPAGGDWLLADGRLVAVATYPAYFDAVGHKFNGGVDPGGGMVRIQDKRGRATVGADNMGTAQGAAGRLPNSNRVAGQNGGAERHTLSTSEIPSHTHTPATVDVRGGNGETGILGGATPIATTNAATTTKPVALTAAGGGDAHNNLQPYEVENVIVRVR